MVITAFFPLRSYDLIVKSASDIIAIYAVRCSLTALFRAATAFFLRFMLGFSKCWRFLASERIPVFSHCFLNRLNAFSNGSFSPTLIPDIHFPPLFSVFRRVAARSISFLVGGLFSIEHSENQLKYSPFKKIVKIYFKRHLTKIYSNV